MAAESTVSWTGCPRRWTLPYCECACECECECECVLGIFQTRWVPRRFTPVCRSRCVAGGVPAPGGSYGTWDHPACVWFCLCRPLAVLAAGHRGPAGLRIARGRRDLPNARLGGDRSSGAGGFARCLGPLPSSRADSRRSVEVDVARLGQAAAWTEPGSTRVWTRVPCAWFC